MQRETARQLIKKSNQEYKMRSSTVLALFIAVFAVILYVGHTAVTKDFDDFGENVIDHKGSDSRGRV